MKGAQSDKGRGHDRRITMDTEIKATVQDSKQERECQQQKQQLQAELIPSTLQSGRGVESEDTTTERETKGSKVINDDKDRKGKG